MKDNDIFHGDNKKLAESIEALLALDAKGCLVPHGIGGAARTLLSAGLQRLTASNERVDVLERALGGMLFAFDDGVGREWSTPLLDYARTLTPAVEFTADKPRPIRFADLPPHPHGYTQNLVREEFEEWAAQEAEVRGVGETIGLMTDEHHDRYSMIWTQTAWMAWQACAQAGSSLMRDALDHIARTCHQSRQQSRRIRWIEARANGALEGKTYDAKLLDLPVEVDREIDRLKRRDRRQLTRIRELEALLREAHGYVNDVAHDPDVWLKIDAVLNGESAACTHEWTDDGEFTLVCTACGAKEDYTQALQHAFELGGTDDGAYHLEADELCEVLRLHSNQKGD